MCILCDSLAGTHHPSDEPHKDYKKHGDGINDPKLVIDYDPLFSSVLGTGVNRRELLKWGSLGALAGLRPTRATFAQEKRWVPTVRLGFLPITIVCGFFSGAQFNEMDTHVGLPWTTGGWRVFLAYTGFFTVVVFGALVAGRLLSWRKR